MMFMMPIPPTSSEIPATPPRKIVNTLRIVVAVSRKLCWVKMVKSSSPIGVVRAQTQDGGHLLLSVGHRF